MNLCTLTFLIMYMYAKLTVIVYSLFQKFLHHESFSVFVHINLKWCSMIRGIQHLIHDAVLFFYLLRYFPVSLYQQEYFAIIIILRSFINIDNISKAKFKPQYPVFQIQCIV